PSIALHPGERNTLLDYLRCPFHDPALRLRAHVILLLADGHPWATVAAVLYCSTRTIGRWHKRFAAGRLDALLGRPRGAPARLRPRGPAFVARWPPALSPRAFGYLRSRWTCALLALALGGAFGLGVSRETVRRWLHREGVVWRRPRPVLRRRDPDRDAILGKL